MTAVRWPTLKTNSDGTMILTLRNVNFLILGTTHSALRIYTLGQKLGNLTTAIALYLISYLIIDYQFYADQRLATAPECIRQWEGKT